MDRDKKKKIAVAMAALLYLQGEEQGQARPSRWAAAGRDQIMRDRARIAARGKGN